MLNKPAVAYICELKNIFKKILFSKWTRVTVHFCMHTHKLHKIAKDAYIHVQPAPTCANGVCCLDLFFYSSSMFTSSQPITIRKKYLTVAFLVPWTILAVSLPLHNCISTFKLQHSSGCICHTFTALFTVVVSQFVNKYVYMHNYKCCRFLHIVELQCSFLFPRKHDTASNWMFVWIYVSDVTHHMCLLEHAHKVRPTIMINVFSGQSWVFISVLLVQIRKKKKKCMGTNLVGQKCLNGIL